MHACVPLYATYMNHSADRTIFCIDNPIKPYRYTMCNLNRHSAQVILARMAVIDVACIYVLTNSGTTGSFMGGFCQANLVPPAGCSQLSTFTAVHAYYMAKCTVVPPGKFAIIISFWLGLITNKLGTLACQDIQSAQCNRYFLRCM